jgi:uncharacterized repeat protein (TIGR01451 family)
VVEEPTVPAEEEPQPEPDPDVLQPPTGGAEDLEVVVRLTSDWGSAFAEQDVRYTFVIINTSDEAVQNVELTSRLPANLTVDGATTDQGTDPNLSGNTLTYNLMRLGPGQSVEVTAFTTIRPGVPAGTIIVAQGQVTYESADQPINSNIVTVQIVDEAQAEVATATPRFTATSGPSPTTAAAAQLPSPTGTGAPATAQAQPEQTQPEPPASPTRAAAGVAPQEPEAAPAVEEEDEAPLPATSTGIPLAGFVLLGMTLLVRTVRIKRARERL